MIWGPSGFWRNRAIEALRLLLERAASHGKLAEHAERLERELSYRGVLGDLVGDSPEYAGDFRFDPAGGPSRRRC